MKPNIYYMSFSLGLAVTLSACATSSSYGYVEEPQPIALPIKTNFEPQIDPIERAFEEKCAARENKTLKPEAQSRIVLTRIGHAIRNKSYSEALSIFEVLDCIPHERPVELFLTEAKIANQEGQLERAKSRIQEFLNKTDGEHSSYDYAIALFVKIEDKLTKTNTN